LKLYGTKRTTRKAKVKYSRAASDTSFKTTDDVSGWQNGDQVVFSRRSGVGRGATNADSTIYTLSGAPTGPVSGEYTVTLTAGLSSQGIPANDDNGHWTHAVNLSGYGITFKNSAATSSAGWNFSATWFLSAEVDGVRFQDVGTGLLASGLSIWTSSIMPGENSLKGTTLFNDFVVIGVTANVKNSPAIFLSAVYPSSGYDSTISNCHAHLGMIFGAADLQYSSTDNKVYITNCSEYSWQKNSSLKTIGSNTYLTNYQVSNFLGTIVFDKFSHSANGISIYQCANDNGTTGYPAFNPQGSGLSLSRIYIDDSELGISIATPQFSIGNTGSAWKIGAETANTDDFRFDSNYSDFDVIGPNIPNFDIIGTQTNQFDGTSIRFLELNGDTNDFRSFTSSSSFTSQSSATKMRARHLTSAKYGYADYVVSTGICSGAKIYSKVNVEILNAAYYGGTYTVPSIKLTYNDGANTSQGNATASTGVQAIYALGTSSVDNRKISIRLSSKTDVLTSSGDVDWSSLYISLRKYGSIYQTKSFPVYRLFGPSEILYSFPSLETNNFISQTTKSTVAAYSGITINHGTGTITLTTNHTLAEVYDYSQYNLELDANLGYAEWLTSNDGITFNCSYNIIIDGCTLSGSGNINAPGKSLTLQNSGVVTFPVTYSAGTRVPLNITGLINGSRVRIQKTSDGTLISNGTVSGTTYTDYYVWTSDLGVTLRVRKSSAAPKYLPFESSGTIKKTGLEMIAAQVADTLA
jgi:hypothetical protein